MPERVTIDVDHDVTEGSQWPGIDSVFRLVVVAALRSKMLQRGAPARIDADPGKRKPTSIALEEVKRGKVPFTIGDGSKIKKRVNSSLSHVGTVGIVEDSWLA